MCQYRLVVVKDLLFGNVRGMKDVTEIRRLKLKKLELEYGSQVVLAEVIELSPARVNHLLTGQRNIGEKAARKIEQLIKKPIGWLDTLDSDLKPTNHNGHLESANLTPEQLLLIKGMIAQFEQSNPAKAENKSLTYPTENVGGGVAQPSAAYDVKIPVQQAQAQDMREAEFSNSDSARYLALIKQSCIDHLCFCDKSPSPSPDLSYAAMIARTNLK